MRRRPELLEGLERLERRLVGFWFAPRDARAYAGVRVGLGLASLVQLAALWPLRSAFFAADGMIDGSVVIGPWAPVALFHLVRSEPGLTLAFGAVALAMAALAIGWVPRLAAAVVAYWHLSLYYDLSPAMSGYDTVLRVASVILVVSPLGERYTLMPWRKTPPPEPAPAYGLYLLQLQVACIYLSTVWLKLGDSYWRDGQFTAYFMLSQYSLMPIAAVARWQELSVVLTYATLATEASVPFLLWRRRTRWLGVLLGAGLHLGIAVTSNLMIFSLSMLMLYPAFLTTADLDALARVLAAGKRKLPGQAARRAA